jgi:RNase P/RNase MRP subunit p29
VPQENKANILDHATQGTNSQHNHAIRTNNKRAEAIMAEAVAMETEMVAETNAAKMGVEDEVVEEKTNILKTSTTVPHVGMMSTIQAHIVTIQMAASTCPTSNATRHISTQPKAQAWWPNTNHWRQARDAAWDRSWRTQYPKHNLSWNASSNSANNNKLHKEDNQTIGKAQEDSRTIGKEPIICSKIGDKTIGNQDGCDR